MKRGDVKAFHEIFVTYSERLFEFSFSYLKDSFTAEEIVQDVFMRIWEIREDIDEDKSFKSFLYQMTVNRVFNHMKHQVVKQKYEKYILNSNYSFGDSPESQLLFSELDNRIGLLLQKIPAQQRNVFKLSRIDGLSNPEIAKQLGLSIRTVENQIYRTTKFLKENLKGEYLFILFCVSNSILQFC
ncbi:RNA polymerase sigma-70 factor [Sunxiuqinia rutila]|uniref:RNA polymerase sigma-70 factor n=1 Tax=Sunxiuqinia rutila TaxID=1397841 RepID=UPI003D3632B9